MKKYILFLYLMTPIVEGWIEFSVEDSKEFCEKVKEHVMEGNPNYTDGACVLKMPSGRELITNKERGRPDD